MLEKSSIVNRDCLVARYTASCCQSEVSHDGQQRLAVSPCQEIAATTAKVTVSIYETTPSG